MKNLQLNFLKTFKKRDFKKWRTKVGDLMNNPKKAKELLDKAMNKAENKRQSHIDEIWVILQLVFKMFRDWLKGDYRYLGNKTVALIIIALLYFVSPMDMMPDFIPGGFLDDVTVIGYLFNEINFEIEKYKIWLEQRNEPLEQ